jgi:hypothetical protein
LGSFGTPFSPPNPVSLSVIEVTPIALVPGVPHEKGYSPLWV